MDSIHAAVFCACFAALGLTLAEHLLPPERFEKQIRMMLALLMLTAVLRPLTKLDFSAFSANVSEECAESAEIREIAEQAQNEALANSIAAALNRSLEEQNVPCRVTGVLLHISPDGSIHINEVRAEGNLLTGAVYLHEWLGDEITVTEGGLADA